MVGREDEKIKEQRISYYYESMTLLLKAQGWKSGGQGKLEILLL